MNKEEKLRLKHLMASIDKILFEDWDPIGVNDCGDIEAVRDEYSSYVPQIAKLLISNCTELELVKHILKLERNQMGIYRYQKRSKSTIDLLMKLKPDSIDTSD